jgi:hypothetical protein
MDCCAICERHDCICYLIANSREIKILEPHGEFSLVLMFMMFINSFFDGMTALDFLNRINDDKNFSDWQSNTKLVEEVQFYGYESCFFVTNSGKKILNNEKIVSVLCSCLKNNDFPLRISFPKQTNENEITRGFACCYTKTPKFFFILFMTNSLETIGKMKMAYVTSKLIYQLEQEVKCSDYDLYHNGIIVPDNAKAIDYDVMSFEIRFK